MLPDREPLTFYQLPAPDLAPHSGEPLPLALRIITPSPAATRCRQSAFWSRPTATP
ncbi:hypothetical protein ULG90_11680 [Halopseudomonas pachastrellae]|nr:hypothetical protein ULG90_11680 [Halopseudomonas pachastrellae]